jgi:PIN domain nuclease of toxin-antitoxin system
MATVVCLDSHAVVALFIGGPRKIGRTALREIDRCQPVITPAVILELQMLHEIGRIKFGAMHIFTRVAKAIGLAVDEPAWEPLYQQILKQSWTRDPFDRTIVGHAICCDALLVSKDEVIQRHYAKTVW